MPHEVADDGTIIRRRGRPSKAEAAELARLQAAEPAPRPLGADVPAKRQRPPTPATDRLRALQAQRDANDGWLIPPPMPAHEMAEARLIPTTTPTGTKVAEVDATTKAIRAWIQAIVDADGTRADLSKAWTFWQPQAGAHAKYHLKDWFDGLMLPADRREFELRSQARDEERPWRAKANARRGVKQARQRLEEARKELAKAEAALEASIEAERQIDAEWDLSRAPEAA